MISSIDVEKAFDNIQHQFMIKILNKMGTEGKYLNITKTTCDKPSANIIANSEKQSVSSKSRNTQRCPLSLLSFNIILGVLAREIRQEKEIKGTPTGKKEVKLFCILHTPVSHLLQAKFSQNR